MNKAWTAGWALMLWCVMGAAIAMGQATAAPSPVAFTGKDIQPAAAPATWAKGLLDSGQAFDISHFVLPAQGIADDKLAALKQSMTQMRAIFPEKAAFAWVDGKSFDNIGSSPNHRADGGRNDRASFHVPSARGPAASALHDLPGRQCAGRVVLGASAGLVRRQGVADR